MDTLVAVGSHRGAPIPWWLKIGAKLVLRRLPVPHATWTKLNVFRHSYISEDANELVASVQGRLAWFRARTGRAPHTVLELGPGEITTTAVVYKALGVARSIYVDVGDFGSQDVAAYKRVAEAAARRGLATPDLTAARDRTDIFARCGVEYYVHGLSDVRQLPGGCADLVTSNAVIEHIRLAELDPTFSELRRVIKDDGLVWHVVDFQDHLGGKLENLRFSPAVWESEWMASSGFYTNRVSASAIVERLRRSGLEVEIETRCIWPAPPTTADKISGQLRSSWTKEDLHVCSMSISGRPNQVRRAN